MDESKAAEDWSSYEIPTDAQMLAKHNAEELRKLKHVQGILHNMVLDKNYHGAHEANTVRKQQNEQSKALTAAVAKLAEVVSRFVELEEKVLQLEADNLQKQERLDGHEKRLDKASDYLKTMKTKEVAK